MTVEPEPGAFARAGRRGRGALRWARPDFFWTGGANFYEPVQIAEMVLRVPTSVVGLAWLTARPSYLERVPASPFGWAPRIAANLRTVLAPLMLFGLDMVLGTWAMGGVSRVARLSGARGDLPQAGLGETAQTTAVSGALVSATMLLSNLAIWGGREAFLVLRRGNRIAIGAQPRDGEANGSV